MRRDEAACLLDMLAAAKDALELSPGLTFQQFTGNCLHQSAVFKSIEVIGEAPLMLAGKPTKKIPRFHHLYKAGGSYEKKWKEQIYKRT